MQISRFIQIVVFVTALGFSFLGCIALLGFFTLAFLILLLLYLLECAGEFRLCGGDHGLCPLDSHKPLKRLDRNFKCFGAVTFAWFIGFCAMLLPRLLSLGSHLTWARLNKKINNKNPTSPQIIPQGRRIYLKI